MKREKIVKKLSDLGIQTDGKNLPNSALAKLLATTPEPLKYRPLPPICTVR